MSNAKSTSFIQGALFEEDYLIRTLGALGYSPDVALTELVANAWDAGATEVSLSIPEKTGEKLIVQDNGTGLTKEEFHNRWMKLGYNRLKHQGRMVSFPKGIQGNRYAYGRNGVGRHGLLCFNNEYSVITSSKGTKSTFIVTTLREQEPFVIKSEAFERSKTNGTRLEVFITKNLPNLNKIADVISARFLHDPKFVVSINNRIIHLEEFSGLISSTELQVDELKFKAHFIDSKKAAKSTIYQGIAFWQGGRLVGEPSWILGNEAVIDGRTSYAKRYSVVVETNDLGPFILEDWTGFKKHETINRVFLEVHHHVQKMFSTIARENIEETKAQIKNEFHQEYSTLSPLAKFEVNEAIESISITNPTAKQESISLAVQAIINLEKTRSGKELLKKLSSFSEDDAAGLNQLLEKWSIRDALTVLEEIDNRISVIEAIKKLSGDKDVDELHTLHPLVTAARWLFGPEFESAEYASNRQLHTAVETIFKTKIQKGMFKNHKKRPDIVVLPNSTISITGTEVFENSSSLSTVNKILILELKRGGFKLTRQERDQAVGYVEDFLNCGTLIGHPYVEAFVIGQEFSEKVQPTHTVQNNSGLEKGKIRIATFSQIVDTAQKRLFGLRDKLNERYDDITGVDLMRKQAIQLHANF
jgi:hypothetical protein